MTRYTGLSLLEAKALSAYPDPVEYIDAVMERKRKDRIDLMLDVAQAVRAAGCKKETFVAWMRSLEAERKRTKDDSPAQTIFERLRGERKDTVFSRLKRAKNGRT